MVAPTADAGSPPSDPPHHSHKGGVRRLASSAVRLASLQLKIWLTQVKSTALKIGLFVGLFLAAAVIALLAIIFLYIGVFKLLCKFMEPVWAFLIYGGVHLVLAAVLALVAMKILTKKDEDDDEDDHPHHADDKHHAPHANASGKERS